MSDTEAAAPDAAGAPTRLIAVHNFPKEQPQDLSLVKGTLYLGSYLKDEWWVGIDPETGEEGCFPANFVADEGSEAAEKAIARVKAKAKKSREKAAAAAAARAAEADEAGVNVTGGVGNGDEDDAEGKDFDTVELEITDDGGEKDGSGEGGESTMTSGEAAAAAAEKAISAAAATVEMHADSKLRNLKSMIVIRVVKWLVVLLVFSCVAGSNYHLLNLDEENTVETIFKTGLWRVKSAVSFTVAWGVFMWLFEGSVALFFMAWREGYVDPTLNNKFDINNLSIVLLTYDALCFFLIIVAGFNMGAAAGIPASAVELLLKQDGKAGVVVPNNCTLETLGYTETYVAFPAIGNSTDYQNLRSGPLTAGVFLLIVLVHLVVLSLMQDYLWLLTDYHGQNSPAPDISAKSAASADAKDRGVHTPVDTDDSEQAVVDGETETAREDDSADVIADDEEAE